MPARSTEPEPAAASLEPDTADAAPSPTAEGTSAEVDLSSEELLRYSRHLMLPEIGRQGQLALKRSRVLVVGAGGLGSPVSMYLAAAGVGTLGLVDFDVVDASNLHRQILYGASDVGRSKLEVAAERLLETNPHTRVVLHPVRIDRTNARELIAGYDLIVDGTDNFPTRYLVNDACVLESKPNVYGSIFRFEGQVSLFWGAEGPCYRCLFAEPPPPELVPSCAEGGVLGVLPGIIGCLQANEAIKFLTGIGDGMLGRLLLFDALRMRFHEVRLKKNPTCPVCSEEPTITELVDYEQFCGVGASASELADPVPNVAPKDAARWLRDGTAALLDVRTEQERDIAKIDGAVAIPVADIGDRLGELPRDRRWIVHCHRGPRSLRAAQQLRDAGFDEVYNLEGGIDAWAEDVDPSLARY